MSDSDLKTQLHKYFEERGTYPVTLTFKNEQVDDKFLVDLDKTIHNKFNSQEGIKILNTRIIEGEYWSGLFVEFNRSEFENIDSTDFRAMQSDKTLYSQLANLYDEFSQYDTRITGLSTGSSVYSVAALESLNKSFFNTF